MLGAASSKEDLDCSCMGDYITNYDEELMHQVVCRFLLINKPESIKICVDTVLEGIDRSWSQYERASYLLH